MSFICMFNCHCHCMLETTAPMLFVFSQKMQNNQIFFTQIYSCPHDALATTNFEKGSVVSNNNTKYKNKCQMWCDGSCCGAMVWNCSPAHITLTTCAACNENVRAAHVSVSSRMACCPHHKKQFTTSTSPASLLFVGKNNKDNNNDNENTSSAQDVCQRCFFGKMFDYTEQDNNN